MSIDEVIRVGSYALLAPGFFYLGLVARNHNRYLMAAAAYSLTVFFFLLLVGLVMLRFAQPSRLLICINTGVVVILTGLVWRMCWHYLRLSWLERRRFAGES
jgi:hypothetical protein